MERPSVIIKSKKKHFIRRAVRNAAAIAFTGFAPPGRRASFFISASIMIFVIYVDKPYYGGFDSLSARGAAAARRCLS
jgi:hypothetical protein